MSNRESESRGADKGQRFRFSRASLSILLFPAATQRLVLTRDPSG